MSGFKKRIKEKKTGHLGVFGQTGPVRVDFNSSIGGPKFKGPISPPFLLCKGREKKNNWENQRSGRSIGSGLSGSGSHDELGKKVQG